MSRGVGVAVQSLNRQPRVGVRHEKRHSVPWPIDVRCKRCDGRLTINYSKTITLRDRSLPFHPLSRLGIKISNKKDHHGNRRHWCHCSPTFGPKGDSTVSRLPSSSSSTRLSKHWWSWGPGTENDIVLTLEDRRTRHRHRHEWRRPSPISSWGRRSRVSTHLNPDVVTRNPNKNRVPHQHRRTSMLVVNACRQGVHGQKPLGVGEQQGRTEKHCKFWLQV